MKKLTTLALGLLLVVCSCSDDNSATIMNDSNESSFEVKTLKNRR